jgi:hypothetical protein
MRALVEQGKHLVFGITKHRDFDALGALHAACT